MAASMIKKKFFQFSPKFYPSFRMRVFVTVYSYTHAQQLPSIHPHTSAMDCLFCFVLFCFVFLKQNNILHFSAMEISCREGGREGGNDVTFSLTVVQLQHINKKKCISGTV